MARGYTSSQFRRQIADAVLARPVPDPAATAAIQVALLLAWHWVLLPLLLISADAYLRGGASNSASGATSGSGSLRLYAVLAWSPVLAIVLWFPIIQWGVAYLFARLVGRGRRFPLFVFVRNVWQVYLYGTPVVLAYWSVIGLVARSYDLAMNMPILWALATMWIPAVLLKTRSWRPYPMDCCQTCGYRCTGCVSERCSECGTPFEVGIHQNAENAGQTQM